MSPKLGIDWPQVSRAGISGLLKTPVRGKPAFLRKSFAGFVGVVGKVILVYPKWVSLVMVGEKTCRKLATRKSDPFLPTTALGDGTAQSDALFHKPKGIVALSRWRLQEM